jgi:hypothetical protein
MGPSALDNLVAQWLYQDNPKMQVEPPHRFANFGQFTVAPTSQLLLNGVSLNLNRTWQIDDGLFIEWCNLVLGDATATIVTPAATSVGSMSVLLGRSGVFLPVAQVTSTANILPPTSSLTQGQHSEVITPPTGKLILMRDLAQNREVALSFPGILSLVSAISIINTDSVAHTINVYFDAKVRPIQGLSNEG